MDSRGAPVMEERNKRVVPLCKEYESCTHDDAMSLAQDGSVDFHGNPSNKLTTGRVKANVFIIGMEIGERLAFYGISANLVTYLTRVLHEGTAPSAKNVNNWIGATFIAPLLGAFVADAYWGRFWTILVFGCVYFVGLVMLTLSVTLDFFKPTPCSSTPTSTFCPPATATQVGFFYFSLYLMSFGSGSMKPCIAAFGADQFDEEDKSEDQTKKSFFNWWVFGISIGGLISATVMVYIQDSVSWGWGFGVPTVLLGMFLVVYIAGIPFYRHKAPTGSPITQIIQVVVAAVRNSRVRLPADPGMLYEVRDKEALTLGRRYIPHSNTFRFLDKAAALHQHPSKLDEAPSQISSWKLATVTEVEEVKLVLRLIPIWVAAVLFATMPAQIATFYTRQGTTLDVSVGGFKIPAASLQSVNPITIVLLMPIYDKVFVPVMRRITGNVRGISMLQRIGVGLVISLLSMIAAAITEVKRVSVAREHGLLDHPEKTIPLSVFILLPQYVLIGAAEVFTSVGALEFFYDQAPDSMRSLGTALFLTTIGVGNFLSSVLLSAVVRVTSRGKNGSWIVDNLNRCRLDYFYWLLAGLSAMNLLFFMGLGHWYKYKKTESAAPHEDHVTFSDDSVAPKRTPARIAS